MALLSNIDERRVPRDEDRESNFGELAKSASIGRTERPVTAARPPR
jgi:hypothetical protein